MSRGSRTRVVRVLVGVTSLAASVLVLGSAPANAEGTQVVAAPDGHGTACSVRQPCSITQAKTTAADLSAHGHTDVHVELTGGTYRLSSTLTFGPQDSGHDGGTITWEAAPDAHPVLSGGVPISGWHPTDGNPNLWSAPVPANLVTRQLYADGQRVPRASGASPVALTQTPDGFVAADDTLASWRNPSNIEFVFDGGHGSWTQPRCDVASISGKVITMRQPCWDNMKLPGTPVAPDGDNPAGGFPALDTNATPSRIENAYELLSPGTWYLDQSRHVVYYDARTGESPATMSFVAPVLEQLVTTSSTADNPLHGVTFSGITFAYTTWLTPSGDDGFAEIQATMYVRGRNGARTQGLCQYVEPRGSCPFAAWSRPPAAVDLVGTRDVSVVNDVFEHLGAAGLGAYHGAGGDLISGNEITDVSGNGIEFGTTDDAQPTAFATNLSSGRRTTQSSTRGGDGAGLAVDGSTATTSGSRTLIQDDPWWQVDLGGVRALWQTAITARADSGLSDFWVFVSATPFDTSLTPRQQSARPGVWSSHQATVGADGRITVPTDTAGRYVMVQASGSRSLGLADVAVGSGAEIAVGNTISDNYVHDVGAEYTGAVGIWGGYARGTTITHNEVGDLPYSGISFGWGGWHTNATTPFANPNIQADNVISDNVMYNTMGTRTDGGPIYTNGPQGQSPQHGLTLTGNVAFGSKAASNAFYNDEGSAYILIDGNVQYADTGNFNGGCSTTGHIIVGDNYHVGALNSYGCDNVGDDFVDGGGNTLVASNPGVGVLPADVLASAGLRTPYQHLTTARAPEVAVVSPITDHQVLISGRGFVPGSTVAVHGQAATHVGYVGPHQLTATLPDTVSDGDVTVTNPAGTSVVDDRSYTYDPSLDVALGRQATQSSTGFDSPAAHAVDGDTNGSFGAGSLSHTNSEPNPWWQVDLGSAQALSAINGWNRTDCCADRDTDYWVFVSSTPFDHTLTPVQQAARPGVWSSHQTGQLGRPTRIPAPTTGRYVMVQLAGTNYLALAEVQVFRKP
jgi:hypothetical protein